MAISFRRARQNVDFWPGYVDGLAGLLMVMLFLLLFYVLGELALSTALNDSQRDSETKSNVITDLLQKLSVIKSDNTRLLNEAESHRQDIKHLLGVQDKNRQTIESAQFRIQALVEHTEELSTKLDQSKSAYLALRQEYDQFFADSAAREKTSTETIAVQSEKILLLENRIREQEDQGRTLAEQVAALSEDKVLLVGRVSDLELLEKERLEVLANLNADIQSLRSLREQLQEQLNTQSEIMSDKDRSLQKSFAEMRLLNQQILALNAQLEEVNTILAVREQTINTQKLDIESLGTRLNTVMASEISRLQRYRSDFFGRMRELLADRPEVRVVDDRFVLQSEVLFPSSSADLSDGGREQLRVIASLLKDLLLEVPDDLPWILRIDGHTDTRPIHTARFPSNWELSAARAIAVVKYLHELGIPKDRLAPTGFADLHPVESRDDEIAHRRNRRIEMKLTQR